MADEPAREDKYLTVAEIAAQLRVAPMTIYRAVNAGEFEGAVRAGKRGVRIPAASYEAWLKASEITPGTPRWL
ncbi:helix-turn-helix transcriptional regulator, partial [Nonomuraea sp. NPDC050394]|uniref:helix-turn-helix transcriptional regulator n=1 Tax=Nonomuraea sp. NPDC050394 TaxID=3364363 RepID=UPI0037945B1A